MLSAIKLNEQQLSIMKNLFELINVNAKTKIIIYVFKCSSAIGLQALV